MIMSTPRARKPEHIMYDSCCLARQQAENIPWFDGIGMCVDPWHFENKHKTMHEYCQIHCDARDYPELLTADGKWFFKYIYCGADQCVAWRVPLYIPLDAPGQV